jgi:uncharacterized membrane protein YidH (DUF202 family)
MADFQVARRVPATRRALLRRRRTALAFVALGLGIVWLAQARLDVSDHSLLGHLVGPLGIIGFVVFFFALVRYRRIWQIEWIANLNPWVEWSATVVSVPRRWRSPETLIVLRHEEWERPVLRVVRPGRLASGLNGLDVVWAAGNPAKTLAVSPPDGALPLGALRLRSPLRHRARTVAAEPSMHR